MTYKTTAINNILSKLIKVKFYLILISNVNALLIKKINKTLN